MNTKLKGALGAAALATALGTGGWALLGASPVASAAAQEMTVWKTPWCGCCGAWVDHAREAGFEVTVKEAEDLNPVKNMAGIAPSHQSCHTALVGGYAIEGHVPAQHVRRLLAERPDARGLAVPGMPIGSPGMEVPGQPGQPYDVLLLNKDGSTEVFASHE